MRTSIQQALEQVQELRARVLENRRFRGYSGLARVGGAMLALLATLFLSLPFIPERPDFHVLVWGAVCLASLLINYLALFRWYLTQDTQLRELALLRPAIDALPALLVGGVLTAVMLTQALHGLLFGTWMLLFGVMHTSSRHALPPRIWWLGVYYITCGIWYFGFLDWNFLNPWPMGIVFFIGELAGGLFLRREEKPGD